MKHLLCSWHVHRLVKHQLKYSHVNCMVGVTCRTWRGHLNGVISEHRVEIYQMLCLMETELNQEKFHHLMSQFIQYWKPREPEFMKLFEGNYATRPGILLV